MIIFLLLFKHKCISIKALFLIIVFCSVILCFPSALCTGQTGETTLKLRQLPWMALLDKLWSMRTSSGPQVSNVQASNHFSKTYFQSKGQSKCSSSSTMFTCDSHLSGLAVDYFNERLYWADAKLSVIGSVRLDGSDPVIAVSGIKNSCVHSSPLQICMKQKR